MKKDIMLNNFSGVWLPIKDAEFLSMKIINGNSPLLGLFSHEQISELLKSLSVKKEENAT